MRTLYFRIIVTTFVIMISSSIIAFILSNGYYQYILKPKNDAKVTEIAHNIVYLYKSSEQSLDDYLSELTDLGYSFYLTDPYGSGRSFGKPFDEVQASKEVVDHVLAGGIYHGIKNYPWRLFVTGFFDHTLENTIGVPIESNEGLQYALFVRANSAQQFGEMRIFFAVLIVLILLLSFLFILFSTRWIVKPIQLLKIATRKIAAGNYHIKLSVNRKDEIGRLAKDFSVMSQSLRQTEEKRQAFVSSVSHEIQSPLASIQGFSQALQEEELTEDARHYYLSIIEKESKRLSALSRQLLTLSQLDQTEEKLEFTTFHISEQLKDILSTLEWQWRQKHLTIQFDNQDILVKGEPKLLYQVWMNVITNAIRYTPDGGDIFIQVQKRKNDLRVVVSDTGVGIGEEDLRQIFDRFYKVDKARTRTEGGTGLGVAIAKKIVELHEGTIMVESDLGQGTKVIVTLPQV
ncbi:MULTISPECIES: HAMP domain-containing sensor histidine kinase [Clostridia]|uniref:sensor histidine kinase n=1 Tax=Clostridia TaxID=186801 RepID=UPI000EA13CC2|nr:MULTISPECIES: HAMP domain-containing sensor histidine kinase [Clostridia]NBJ70598.1 sensor histidine kinase [Roseburia sp. 1XD42-34]RKI76598.1 sensor histidine kinase [Clostridium sp. 1xD42-85]